MSVAERLDALRESAVREVDMVRDETLLSKKLESLAEQIAQRHYLEPLRLRRAVYGIPRAVRLSIPGGPGAEHALTTVPATRAELFVPVVGTSTLARLGEEGADLSLTAAEVDLAEERLVIAYVAEHPVAAAANAFFAAKLDEAEAEVAVLAEQVKRFNQDLPAALVEALRSARSRAKERRTFANGLEHPRPSERPWTSAESETL
jgi:hypothetical protein